MRANEGRANEGPTRRATTLRAGRIRHHCHPPPLAHQHRLTASHVGVGPAGFRSGHPPRGDFVRSTRRKTHPGVITQFSFDFGLISCPVPCTTPTLMGTGARQGGPCPCNFFPFSPPLVTLGSTEGMRYAHPFREQNPPPPSLVSGGRLFYLVFSTSGKGKLPPIFKSHYLRFKIKAISPPRPGVPVL